MNNNYISDNPNNPSLQNYKENKPNSFLLGKIKSSNFNIFGRDDLPINIIEKAENSLNKFRQKLISIGQFALFNLANYFKLIDNDSTKTFNYDDLMNISNKFRVDLSQSESINLFQALDKTGSYFVEIDHFLNLLKGEMNERRKNIIELAFKILDIENKGVIDLGYLKKRFNVRNNIDVMSRKKSEEEAFGEFLHSLEYHFSSYKEKFDRRITLEDFIDYYKNISFCVENDDYFELMVKSTWKF